MPARSNDFQKLVKAINRHLAPSDAVISESAMLYDAESETNREIDILVQSTLIGCDLKIGIEVTAEANPMEVRKVESFREKHRKVHINQTIIVSKKGFTDSAKKYAAKNNIKLLTFGSAKTENWLKTFERLKGLSIYGRKYTLRSVSADCAADKIQAGFTWDVGIMVSTAGGQVTLSQFAGDQFMAAEISKHAFKQLMEHEKSNTDPLVEVGFNLNEQFVFTDPAGRTASPQTTTVVMAYRTNYQGLDTQQISYDGGDMLVGGFFDEGTKRHAHVVFNEKDGHLKGTIEVSENFIPSHEGNQ